MTSAGMIYTYDSRQVNGDKLHAKSINGTWNNATLDFTTRTAYDANGRIRAMLQKDGKLVSTMALDGHLLPIQQQVAKCTGRCQ